MIHVSRSAMLVALAASTVVVGNAGAQIRASERGGAMQVVDGTTIRIEYGRPQAKGRDLFGDIVPWGKVWTGANWATTLDIDRDITVNGVAVPAGRYSLWLEVQPEEWTVIIDPQPRRFHMMPPPESDDQIRFVVKPGTGPYTEIMTWAFPQVRPTGTTARLAWGETTLDLKIGVQPSRPLTTPEEIAQRYVGEYTLELGPQLGNREVSFDVRYEVDRLIATWEGSPNELLSEPYLIYLGAGMFIPGERDEDGNLVDMLAELIFEFDPPDATATGFELRAMDDELWGTAVRK